MPDAPPASASARRSTRWPALPTPDVTRSRKTMTAPPTPPAPAASVAAPAGGGTGRGATAVTCDTDAVACERCHTAMFRMHAVWRCPGCGFKTDCCGW